MNVFYIIGDNHLILSIKEVWEAEQNSNFV